MPATVLKQLGVLTYLALAQRGEAGTKGLGEPHAADDKAECDAEISFDGHTGKLKSGCDGEPTGRGLRHTSTLTKGRYALASVFSPASIQVFSAHRHRGLRSRHGRGDVPARESAGDRRDRV